MSGIHASLAKLWKMLTRQDRLRLAGLVVILLIGAVMEAIGIGIVPMFVSLVADPAQAQQQPWARELLPLLGISGSRDLLIAGGAALIFVFLIKTAFTWFTVVVQSRFLLSLQVRFSIDLFNAYMEAPYAFHLGRNPADLMRNCSIEVVHVINRVLIPLLRMLAYGLIGLAVLSLLLVMHPLITLFSIGLFGSTSLIFLRVVRGRALAHGKNAQRHRAQQIKAVNQGLGGLKEARVLGREPYFVAAFHESTSALARAAMHQRITNQLVPPTLELVAVVGILMVTALLLVFGLQTTDIVPTLALFAVALIRLQQSAKTVTSTLNDLRYEHFTINPIYDDHQQLGFAQGFEPGPVIRQRLPFQQSIEFQDVGFQYPGGERPALESIELSIPRGAAVAFVGSTGAGKSTLADVLLGLLSPDHGTIRVDGRDIRENLRGWQASIGYIPQSLYLIDDTLRRNIAFGLEDAEIDEERVAKAARIAQLEEMLADLPEGLDTVVGDRGVRLSGGQRQRVCIARALYHDPSVLILDEATSALDNRTEQHIVDELEAHRGDRTLIVIAHRLSTVRHCDRLYLLSHGRIVAAGTYEELLDNSHQFQQLVVE